MLTAGDEYPIHQTPEPVAFAGSDRNFYDRFFFNGVSPDGETFFAAAMGVYPHLNVIDGAVSILKDGVQRSLYVSRILNMERMDMRVGPLRVEVLEPLKRIRLILEETEGLAVDVTFEGRASPVEEPRFTRREGPRMLMDVTRMTQNGRWSGGFSADGARIDAAGFVGTRDRSWGVRPIGSPDAQPTVPMRPPQFYWLWAPTNFPNVSLFFHVNEDASGGAWNTRAVLAEDGADRDGLIHLNRPKMTLDYTPGSRRAARAVLALEDGMGRPHTVTYTPVQTFLMKGIGYGHPDWRHGGYKGEYAQERIDIRPDELSWQNPENLHIQAICRAVHEGPDGLRADGIGALEQLIIGPHAPSGFRDILDGAA